MANINRLLYGRVRLQPLRHVLLWRTGPRLAFTLRPRQWRTQSSCGAAQKEDGAWRVFRLGDGGPVIRAASLASAVYKEQMLHLLPGDILLAFTDGISEAMNASEDEWGKTE